MIGKKIIRQLYTRYSPLVFRRCMFMLKDNDKALDAMQDTFLQIIKRKNKLQNVNLSGYLYKTATNICLNKIKLDKKEFYIMNDNLNEELTYVDKHEKILETKFILDNIFANEKKSTKQIALLYYLDKLTLAQTAKSVGLSVSGVRKRLHKFKKKYDHTGSVIK